MALILYRRRLRYCEGENVAAFLEFLAWLYERAYDVAEDDDEETEEDEEDEEDDEEDLLR